MDSSKKRLTGSILRDESPESGAMSAEPAKDNTHNVSERYIPYPGTEFGSDSVKEIRIFDIEKNQEPSFPVSLIGIFI